MDRHTQLNSLKVELENLLIMLREDDSCAWTDHFEDCLFTTKQLIGNGFTQNDLNSLSTQIRSVFGGMGSFNDYVPLEKYWGSNEYAKSVFEKALRLKVLS